MLLNKYIKNPRKLKILILFITITLILVTLLLINNGLQLKTLNQHYLHQHQHDDQIINNGLIRHFFASNNNDNENDKTNNNENRMRILKSPIDVNGAIQLEKYDEHKIKARLINEKIQQIKEQTKYYHSNYNNRNINNINRNNTSDNQNNYIMKLDESQRTVGIATTAVHIFYTVPVNWYKLKKKPTTTAIPINNSTNYNNNYNNNKNIHKEFNSIYMDSSQAVFKPLFLASSHPKRRPPRPPSISSNSKILNSAFYPALGLYKPTKKLLNQHFEIIRNCGIGVLIVSYMPINLQSQNHQWKYDAKVSRKRDSKFKSKVKVKAETEQAPKPYSKSKVEFDLYKFMLELVPKYNLSITFELNVANDQNFTDLERQLQNLKTYLKMPGFYKVYSLSLHRYLPVIYISNAYKLMDISATTNIYTTAFCKNHYNNDSSNNSLRNILNALYIGHIRLKSHADLLRRLCFDGYYSKLPSNGATFASTWKNWPYLKSFAMTYKMLFIPTVGPGFAERNKFPRHGDIQRHRSNGRYYGVAWRTAILNHVGFLNIASFNNWADGSQIEEVIPKAGFLDYNPDGPTKYIDLTTHWVGNFIKMRNESILGNIPGNCYEFLNNTIC